MGGYFLTSTSHQLASFCVNKPIFGPHQIKQIRFTSETNAKINIYNFIIYLGVI